ncbi:Activating signal cointegrator 1 complex subunit 2 [Rhynchospora pubera]|uniref:Activating signal cointegrator 1 complex subunit 2 n=1 Tax=Rhynchospora pubera TaxID=906938 RepID=A0AAV8DER0_9POAL|nr:Activating signal cointegrator 1 complex subunit 2 [Rhynchospora pubera]
MSSYSSRQPRTSHRNQMRYMPKTPSGTNPQPPLTTALRSSSATSSSSTSSSRPDASASDENFVAYLPHDEAVASGLGPEAGGLDAVESQTVVDLLNDELAALLKMKPREFWKQVARNTSLHTFLDSYLRSRYRWYDLPHGGPEGIVAGVVVGETNLCRRVFMVLYRMSSNKDPGAASSTSLSMKDHTALLQEKKLLDLPKLLDTCAIYGHDNAELTSSLVMNAIKAQRISSDDIRTVASQFLSIVHTMHDRCTSSLEMLSSSKSHDINGFNQLHNDFLEVLDFINDAVVTLDAFVEAYRPASLSFCASFEMSYGTDELLNTLARIHDSLLPSLFYGFKMISSSTSDEAFLLSIKILSKRTVKFGWVLLEYCYLNDLLPQDQLHVTANMLPAKVEDPLIRGEILLQKLKEMHGEANYAFHEILNSETFLQSLERDFNLSVRVNSLYSNGWIYLDAAHLQYLSQLTGSSHVFTPQTSKISSVPSLSIEPEKDEEAAMMESKISQIKDLFPDYGKGFLSACLEIYDNNPEQVIQHILEGTLHEDLSSLDTSLEVIQPRNPTPTNNRKDKGKGVLVHEPESRGSAPVKSDLKMKGIIENSSSSSSSSASGAHMQGRFTRKSDDVVPDAAVLDSKKDKMQIRSAILAAENEYGNEKEYEDEYDDSFDELGLSIVESSYEETEKIDNMVSDNNSGSSSATRWSSNKKPQFYVKDGKNYSYKVTGAVAVGNTKEAAVVNQAQRETIHGLGRGGNLPLGAVRELTGSQVEDDDLGMDTADDAGRGRGRGGRGRRGGRNNYRKDRAMKKHFAGLGGL